MRDQETGSIALIHGPWMKALSQKNRIEPRTERGYRVNASTESRPMISTLTPPTEARHVQDQE